MFRNGPPGASGASSSSSSSSRPKRAKRAVRRKRYGRKRATRSLTVKTIGGFPDRYNAKLECNVTYISTFVGTGSSYGILKLNSLYQPIAGGGIYTGFQNFMGLPSSTAARQAIYTSYVVRGVSIRVSTSTEVASTGNVIPKLCIAYLPKSVTSTTLSSFELAEQPRSKSRNVNPNVAADDVAIYPLKQYYNMHDILGIRRSTDIHTMDNFVFDASSGGTLNADPTDTRYGVVCLSTTSGPATDATLAIAVSITMVAYVEFYNRNLQFNT